MSKLLPLLLVLFGALGGLGAGVMLRPDPPLPADQAEDAPQSLALPGAARPESRAVAIVETVRVGEPFAVPILQDGRVDAIILLSISLEMTAPSDGAVRARDGRLRDRFLQVLFDHANNGGFVGNFTLSTRMTALRTGLLEAAQEVLGEVVGGVLITEIHRRDL